ncbi:hypothetical protein A2U01_0103266, partial [Trifolium medium]|nr:hypothetical protein [Trifolium medium]
MKKLGIAMEDE